MDGILETMGVRRFEWNGKTWTLPRPNGSAQGMIRAYLQHRERHWIQVQADYDHPDFPKGKMRASEYAAHLSGWRDNCVKGKWVFRKGDWAESMNDPECFAEMIYLCLTQVTEQTETTSREEVRKMVADKAEDADRRRNQAIKDGMESELAWLTCQSELAELFGELLAPTPTIPPQAAGAASH